MPENEQTFIEPGLDPAVKQVAELFKAYFEGPSSSIVTEADANKLIIERLQKLSNLSGPGSPPDLRAAVEQAIEGTTLGHEFSKGFISAEGLVSPLGQFTITDIFVIAKLNLDKIHSSVEEELGQRADDYVVPIRDLMVQCIIEGLNCSPQLPIREIVDKCLQDNPRIDKSIGNLQATLLVAQKDQLVVSRDIMIAGVELGCLCRGMFYRAIVESQGSRLASKISRAAFKNKLIGVPWEIISHVPVIGEFIGPIKIIGELILTLTEKENELAKAQKQMRDTYNATMDYLTSYSLALSTWADWATKLQEALIEVIAKERPKFSADLVG